MKTRRIIILIISIFCLCGCVKEKDALSASEFADTIDSLGYEIVDYKNQFSYAKAAYMVVADNISITYINGNRKYDVEGLFIDECRNVYDKAGEDIEEKTAGGDNWTYLSVTNDDNFYYVSWIEDTYILVESSAEDKNVASKLIRELGY